MKISFTKLNIKNVKYISTDIVTTNRMGVSICKDVIVIILSSTKKNINIQSLSYINNETNIREYIDSTSKYNYNTISIDEFHKKFIKTI